MSEGDAYRKAQFVDCPARLAGLIDRFAPNAVDLLDFGCGHGVKALSLALSRPGVRITGVDITTAFGEAAHFARRELDRALPGNIAFRQILPRAPVAPDASQDAIYSWSVLEHVDLPMLPGVLAGFARALRPGGIVVTQVAPLYFSPFGSHLRAWCAEPWAHLTLSADAFRKTVLGASNGQDKAAWMFGRYEALNRITADELRRFFTEAGLVEVHADLRLTDLRPPAALASTYPDMVLRNNEVFLVHRRA